MSVTYSHITLITATYNGEPFPNLLVQLLYRDKTSEMQILAAKVLAYMCRRGAIDPHDRKIAMKVQLYLDFQGLSVTKRLESST